MAKSGRAKHSCVPPTKAKKWAGRGPPAPIASAAICPARSAVAVSIAHSTCVVILLLVVDVDTMLAGC